jgi:hypothetical protein
MRLFFCFFVLFILAAPVMADENEPFRFGVQTSLNRYASYDPVGPTAGGSGLSVSGIALYNLGREGRAMFNIDRDSYSMKASQTNVGQDVTSFGGGASYQTMLRLTRTWKPWVGMGLGYTSTSYKNRFVFTPGGAKTFYADRDTTSMQLLLNANSEWVFNRDWDMGLQMQFAKGLSNNTSTFRVGIYAIY